MDSLRRRFLQDLVYYVEVRRVSFLDVSVQDAWLDRQGRIRQKSPDGIGRPSVHPDALLALGYYSSPECDDGLRDTRLCRVTTASVGCPRRHTRWRMARRRHPDDCSASPPYTVQ